MAVKYQTLNPQTKAALIRDRLAQLEAEHYRISIALQAPNAGLPGPLDGQRESELAQQIERLQKRLAEVEKDA